MILIIGLGNPGKSYEKTRHNLGFMALDDLATKIDADFKEDKKNNVLIAKQILKKDKGTNQKIILAKPLLYMNNSGEVVKKILDYYKLKTTNIWVIHDDIDIKLGEIKIRLGGSSAGQKGVQSIIENIGTDRFYRFRFGIKPMTPQKEAVEDFVLKKFSKEELIIIKQKKEELIEKIIEYMASKPDNTKI